MVAPQSLNLLVGVRVPIPQPNKAPIAKVMGALFCILEKLPLALMHNEYFSARGRVYPNNFPIRFAASFVSAVSPKEERRK